jgi:Protein of unknown function (DUF1353)
MGETLAATRGVEMPFYELQADGSLGSLKTSVDLRQLRPAGRVFQKVWFQLLEHFAHAESPDDPAPIIINAHDPNQPPTGGNGTDLASVPPMLWGVVASYGLHTMPALMHDQLCNRAADKPTRSEQLTARADADRRFRDTLGESGVSGIRRWLMWSAVRLFGVLSHAGALGALALALVGATSVAISIAVFGAASLPASSDDVTRTVLIVIVVVAVAAVLDMSNEDLGRAVVVGGIGLPLVLLPALSSVVVLIVMWLPAVVGWALSHIGNAEPGPIPPIGPTRI